MKQCAGFVGAVPPHPAVPGRRPVAPKATRAFSLQRGRGVARTHQLREPSRYPKTVGIASHLRHNAALALTAGALALGACASRPPPRIVTVEKPVQVAVPVVAKCDVTVSSDPAYPDTDAAISNAQTLTDLAKMYRGGRALRDARIAYLKALLQQCVG